jgi:predicted 3-demethylubiquinone-9 3-methyltransferase (glyoxalase superfamily)
LWYDGTALDAAQFYASTFPDSMVGAVHRAPSDYPAGKQGDVLIVEFTMVGIPCLGLNGGSAFTHSEAFSFQIAGWCKDKWGLSWQITPRVLTAALADPDRVAAKRAFEAMMSMKKSTSRNSKLHRTR